ncbi:MarR family winged helix-turn-helix transcriptional regulator [Granulibacter bethesdensis]|uniref:Transcriptional regulator, MarR family n=2 Tax=Granulibacter bethesdensis TaxID=364410 RepID=Q0BQ70_GRABC|nr:MarR family transcriptional regulator [Granulibacter bethesdensis]ABI63032.1 Transcriptional regulator, MarR family [Granulibacter bethesdensis CGDNIH1]AHJ64030.1 Transcriptional regulator, MarR family [Granulibacter bethesdensis]AHJ65386.1 Transcriptional regulator, MarR family [Granulibacter bethesdensis CGDNIH4]AHJ68005.1 Transcriptional regulator, MarR family [Granulibacter bethesdensis]APH52904.1 Transcriptional regulator, MarR family [Granulibacter bethesdensis]
MDIPPGEFCRLMHRVTTAWRREITRNVSHFGLTEASWRPLFYLGRAGDGVRQVELARMLDIESPSLVRLLDLLEGQSLIERYEDPADRRSKLLRMTAEGRRVLDQVLIICCRTDQALMALIEPEQLTACIKTLSDLEQVLTEDRMWDVAAGLPQVTEG